MSEDFYLPPEKFFAGVIKAKQAGRVTDELGAMFMMLAEKIANHRYWIRYNHLRDDIISESIFACMKGFKSFEPYTKPHREAIGRGWEGEDVDYNYTFCNNPHAWFTTCCMNNLRQFMGREYNQRNIHNKMRIENGLDPSFGYAEMVADLEAEAKEKAAEAKDETPKEVVIEWE